jgi:thioredoxin-related protein
MSKVMLPILAFVLITGSSLYAQGVNWRSWESGLDEAKRTNKMIMIDVIRDNCRFCIKMDKNVFANEKMAAYIEKSFIPVKVNLSQREAPMSLKVEMTPTFFFFTADQKLIKKIVGSWDQKDFYELTDKIIAENRLKDEK